MDIVTSGFILLVSHWLSWQIPNKANALTALKERATNRIRKKKNNVELAN